MSTAPISPVRRATESGVLTFDGRLITYVSRYYGSFTVPLSEIAVIGEFTTDNGPFIDDWFLVFVLRGSAEWFEASRDAEGAASVCEQLSAALGSTVVAKLSLSTDFASRILWPPALADRPIFSFSPATAEGLLRRLKLYLRPAVVHRLSPEAIAAVSERHA